MSGVVREGFRFFFEGAQGNRVLLADAGDFHANASKALLHYIDDDYVWVMRDNLRNVAEYIERGSEDGGGLRAALAVMVIRELWGKHRLRRILWVGELNRAVTAIARMMPLFHEDNVLCLVSRTGAETAENNIVPIAAAYETLPLPKDYFDVVVMDTNGAATEKCREICLSLRPEGLFAAIMPKGIGLPLAIPGVGQLEDEEGNAFIYARLKREYAELLWEGTDRGQVSRQKRLVSYILDDLGSALGETLTSNDVKRVEAAIAQASLAEENILPMYEELVSDDIKYLASRLKESLIDFRLCRSEEQKMQIFEDYFALRREMKERDNF